MLNLTYNIVNTLGLLFYYVNMIMFVVLQVSFFCFISWFGKVFIYVFIIHFEDMFRDIRIHLNHVM